MMYDCLCMMNDMSEENGTIGCVFYNHSVSSWSSEGCNKTSQTDSTVTCSCNHLTEYSVGMIQIVVNPPDLSVQIFLSLSLSLISLNISCIYVVYNSSAESADHTRRNCHACDDDTAAGDVPRAARADGALRPEGSADGGDADHGGSAAVHRAICQVHHHYVTLIDVSIPPRKQ